MKKTMKDQSTNIKDKAKDKLRPEAKITTCKECGKPWRDHLARRRGYIEIQFKGPKPPSTRDWSLPEELLRDIGLVLTQHFKINPNALEVRGLKRIRSLENQWYLWGGLFGECRKG